MTARDQLIKNARPFAPQTLFIALGPIVVANLTPGAGLGNFEGAVISSPVPRHFGRWIMIGEVKNWQ